MKLKFAHNIIRAELEFAHLLKISRFTFFIELMKGGRGIWIITFFHKTLNILSWTEWEAQTHRFWDFLKIEAQNLYKRDMIFTVHWRQRNLNWLRLSTKTQPRSKKKVLPKKAKNKNLNNYFCPLTDDLQPTTAIKTLTSQLAFLIPSHNIILSQNNANQVNFGA